MRISLPWPKRGPAGESSAAVKSAILLSAFTLICAGPSLVNAEAPNVARHRERVIKVITQHLGLERSALTDNTNICELPAIDALKHFELVLALDEEFRIRIADADVDCLCVVKDIVYYVVNQKRNPQTAMCKKV